MHDPEAFNPKKEFKVKGRGGTDFQPVIDHYNKNSKKYTSIIYFTDGECSSPNNVRCKILWVHSSKCTINQDLPGFKIQLN
jgi:predicted metal-dependent peptidase